MQPAPISLLAFPLALFAILVMFTANDADQITASSIIMSLLYISAACILGGMLGIIVEVITRRVVHYWLIIPLAYFGTYGANFATEIYNMQAVKAEIAESNSATAFPFDPSTNALHVESASFADALMFQYDLPVVYSGEAVDGMVRAHYLVDSDDCFGSSFDAPLADYGLAVSQPRREGRGRRLRHLPCVISGLAPAPQQRIRFGASTPSEHRRGNIRYTLETRTITAPNASGEQIVGGHTRISEPIPILLLMCGESDGNPRCGFAFWQGDLRPLTSATEVEQLAAALSLREGNSPSHDPYEADELVASLRENARVAALQSLDAALADFETRHDQLRDLRLLRREPELLLTRMPEMLRAIEYGIGTDGATFDNARDLFGIVLSLPPASLSPFRARLEAIAESDEWMTQTLSPALR